MIPAFEANSWITGRRGISLPFTDECTPVCSSAPKFKRRFAAVSEHARNRKWKYLELRGGRHLLPNSRASATFWGHTLLLQSIVGSQETRLGSATRRGIRKGQSSDVSIEVSTSLDALKSFYLLLCLTRRRHGLPPQPMRFFESIHRFILSNGQGLVVTAVSKTKPIAAAVFFHRGTQAIYKFGASDEAFQQLRPNNVLMWHAIRSYAERGYATLDFGRTSVTNAGLRRFKLGWGTMERTIEYFRYDYARSDFVVSRDQATGWHNKLFQLMPPAASRALGGLLYKHIA